MAQKKHAPRRRRVIATISGERPATTAATAPEYLVGRHLKSAYLKICCAQSMIMAVERAGDSVTRSDGAEYDPHWILGLAAELLNAAKLQVGEMPAVDHLEGLG